MCVLRFSFFVMLTCGGGMHACTVSNPCLYYKKQQKHEKRYIKTLSLIVVSKTCVLQIEISFTLFLCTLLDDSNGNFCVKDNGPHIGLK